MESRRDDMKQYLDMLAACQEGNIRGAANGRWLPGAFLRDHFQEYSVEIGKPHKAKQRCVNNSIEVVMDAECRCEKAYYFEGFVFAARVVPVVHAWVCLDGKHLDFTLREAPSPYYGVEIPMQVVLFAAQQPQFELAVGVIETLAILPDKKQKHGLEMWRSYARADAPRP